MKKKIVLAVLSIALFIGCKENKTTETQTTSSDGSSKFDELANMSFEENRPTEEQAKTLADELLFQRACQTYLWALPLINTISMKEGSEKTLVQAIMFCQYGKNDWMLIR